MADPRTIIETRWDTNIVVIQMNQCVMLACQERSDPNHHVGAIMSIEETEAVIAALQRDLDRAKIEKAIQDAKTPEDRRRELDEVLARFERRNG
jgi:hypothetical protein